MMIRNAADLGMAIRKARREQGFTQMQLAEVCGCSIMYLSSLERGKQTAELGIALRILNTLGIDLEAKPRSAS